MEFLRPNIPSIISQYMALKKEGVSILFCFILPFSVYTCVYTCVCTYVCVHAYMHTCIH